MTAKIVTKIGGVVASAAVRGWMSSLDYRAYLYDPTVDPPSPSFRGPVIAIFWHEYMLPLFYLRGHTRTAILTSQHRDADWLAEAARHMGFSTIRGSTYRGGSKAVLQYIRGDNPRNLGVACDGPRGPRRRLAQGPIYLSSKLQVPLVVYGIGYDRPQRLPTWDRFAIPRLYGRVRLVIGPRIQIPAVLDRERLVRCQKRVEDLLGCLTNEAESWAQSGTRRLGEVRLQRGGLHAAAHFTSSQANTSIETRRPRRGAADSSTRPSDRAAA